MRERSIFLWIFAVIFTLAIAVFQKRTGPTYPVRGQVEIDNTVYKYKLSRSATTTTPFDEPQGIANQFEAKIEMPDSEVSGYFTYRRFKSHDKLQTLPLKRVDNELIAYFDELRAAGKMEYQIFLTKGEKEFKLSEEPIVMRFKGNVPAYILIPHIFFMFFAMLFSTRTGLEALFVRQKTFNYTRITLICLTLGGLILGPFVQKYAFGAYWTGWPFGGDLTDNKTIVAWIFWFVAFIVLLKKRENKVWPVVAMIILLAVYMIPHSALGSEIDYTEIENPADTLSQ